MKTRTPPTRRKPINRKMLAFCPLMLHLPAPPRRAGPSIRAPPASRARRPSRSRESRPGRSAPSSDWTRNLHAPDRHALEHRRQALELRRRSLAQACGATPPSRRLLQRDRCVAERALGHLVARRCGARPLVGRLAPRQIGVHAGVPGQRLVERAKAPRELGAETGRRAHLSAASKRGRSARRRAIARARARGCARPWRCGREVPTHSPAPSSRPSAAQSIASPGALVRAAR